MSDNKNKICCDNHNWEFIQDASHARGCEFTYGQCTHCGSHLIHMFHTMGNHEHYKIVSPEFITKLQSHEGAELKQFMKNWYDEIS